MLEHEWRYLATVVRVVDGDTLDLAVQLGFTIQVEQRVRLLGSRGGVNTPELHSADPAQRDRARAAMVRVIRTVPPGTAVRVRTQQDKRDGFRRYLAEIITEDGTNLGDALLAEGLADVWKG